MAGLGGACSHVGAVEAGVRIKHSMTYKLVLCNWLIPTAMIAVSYQELGNIDYSK